MRAEQRPPTAGIVACLCYLLVVFVPYLALTETERAGLETYYSAFGVAGPQFLALLVVVATVLFAAGRELRTEPDYAAGLTLVIGMVLTLLVLVWAVSVPEDVVASIGEVSWLEYHRWVVLATAVLLTACSVWYARALALF
ncbi:DUF7548 family protein [Natronobiforma cellulositropha]|uniref:DUF7548 family protein n=1 Tax=Natronobiforma cellulositropha TaxID=1679076 RepID=UPI0021D58AD7|nr:hypothetical protein [Natronobiforma cellulositropha]